MVRLGEKVSRGSMWGALHAIGWSFKKKTPIAREKDLAAVAAKREAFITQQATLNPQRLVFVDESGFRLGSPPRYRRLI